MGSALSKQSSVCVKKRILSNLSRDVNNKQLENLVMEVASASFFLINNKIVLNVCFKGLFLYIVQSSVYFCKTVIPAI